MRMGASHFKPPARGPPRMHTQLVILILPSTHALSPTRTELAQLRQLCHSTLLLSVGGASVPSCAHCTVLRAPRQLSPCGALQMALARASSMGVHALLLLPICASARTQWLPRCARLLNAWHADLTLSMVGYAERAPSAVSGVQRVGTARNALALPRADRAPLLLVLGGGAWRCGMGGAGKSAVTTGSVASERSMRELALLAAHMSAAGGEVVGAPAVRVGVVQLGPASPACWPCARRGWSAPALEEKDEFGAKQREVDVVLLRAQRGKRGLGWHRREAPVHTCSHKRGSDASGIYH